MKSLASDASCLAKAAGKAVKIVLPLLPHVLPEMLYHVVLIERDLDEIFASQEVILQRSGETAAEPAMLRPAYEKLLRQSRRALAASPRARTLRLSHRWVLSRSREAASEIAAFLGLPMDLGKMAAVVDPALHRQLRPN